MPNIHDAISIRTGADGKEALAAYFNGHQVWAKQVPLPPPEEPEEPEDPGTPVGPIAISANGLPAASLPLSLTSDGRWFKDSANQRWIGLTDTAWQAVAEHSKAQFISYIDIRRSQGFTAIQMAATNMQSRTATTVAVGVTPFLATGNSTNITQRRITGNDHWTHLEWCVDQLAARGMIAIIVPLWYGGWGDMWRGHLNTSNAANYGQFLASRLGDRQNVIWMHGGDNRPDLTSPATNGVPSGLPAQDVTAATNLLAEAIRENATVYQPATYHTQRNDAAYNYFGSEPWYEIHAAYSGTDTALRVLPEYQRANAKPVYMVENYYDLRPSAPILSRSQYRGQAYRSFLSGAAITSNGTSGVWETASGWESLLTNDGAKDIAIVSRVMETYRAKRFVPDQASGVSDTLVSGYGSGETSAVGAVTTDATVALVYFPTSRAAVANLNIVTGSVNVAWMNPSTAALVTIAQASQASTLTLTFPSGWTDALLIIQTDA